MNIDDKIFEEIFRKHHKKAFVYLRSAKTKGDNYDPFRETGFDITSQNPLPVKVLTKIESPGSLMYNELGLVSAGALSIILQDRDVVLFKTSAKIKIGGLQYYVHSEAVGNKVLIFKTQFSKFSKVIIFRRDTGNT